jgi:hypothetical protein
MGGVKGKVCFERNIPSLPRMLKKTYIMLTQKGRHCHWSFVENWSRNCPALKPIWREDPRLRYR